MKTDHSTAANNLIALAAVLSSLACVAYEDDDSNAARKAVLEAVKANAETLKDQTV